MLTIPQAIATVIDHVQPFPVESLPLADVLGLVLAEPVVSDVDSPPFDKSQMDGFAVQAADLADGTATLRLLETVTAGRVARQTVTQGTAIQIMTGAPLPAGADAVVRVEDSELRGDMVLLRTRPVRPGDCVVRRGVAMSRGETVLQAGTVLTPQHLGLLAELGRPLIPVRRRPRVAVLATGDELVPIDQIPGPGQIRNSNEVMLTAQIRQMEGVPVPLGVARDERSQLRERILAGLECDVLVLSGGVSAGQLDLVPSELAAAGVEQIFHKVHMKPGKPVWFGVARGTPTRYVFGLPGNPVSSMVCCELFVRTALRRLMGHDNAAPRPVSASLLENYEMRGDRPTFHPAILESTDAGRTVRLGTWQGSADLRALADCNAMAFLPTGERHYRPGDVVDVYSWK